MNANLWLASVLLDEPRLPDEVALASVLATNWPQIAVLEPRQRREGILTFSCGEATLAITLVPRPIPWAELSGPCECAWYWEEATATLQPHQAHLLVVLVDEGNDNLDKSMLLSLLVAAIAKVTDASGIYWGPSRLVHEPSPFFEECRQMSRDSLPLFLWIDFRLEQIAEGEWRLFTTGMEALGHKEFEVWNYYGDPKQLVGDLFNVAHYVVERRKSLGDGDTIGLADGRQMTAREARSQVDEEKPVIQLEPDPAG